MEVIQSCESPTNTWMMTAPGLAVTPALIKTLIVKLDFFCVVVVAVGLQFFQFPDVVIIVHLEDEEEEQKPEGNKVGKAWKWRWYPRRWTPQNRLERSFFCGHELEHVLKIHMDTYVGIESNKNSFLNAEHDMIRFSVIIFF